MKRKGIAAALSLIFCLPVSGRETVTWYVDHTFPPTHIAAGRYAGHDVTLCPCARSVSVAAAVRMSGRIAALLDGKDMTGKVVKLRQA